MFCTNCSKIIKEGAKFCQYCGAPQRNSDEYVRSSSLKFSDTNHPETTRKEWFSNYSLPGLIVAGMVIVALFLALTNLHTCDWCEKTFIGDAYYDAWEADEIMCENCAQDYYSGLDYTRFRVQ